MKPSLQIGLHHGLTLTPQLHNAINLLQLAAFDLQNVIQLHLDTNPILELDTIQPDDTISKENLDEPQEYQWELIYNAPQAANQSHELTDENLPNPTDGLQEYLRWQLNLSPMSELDQIIADTIVDAINPDGCITLPLQEIYTYLKTIDNQISIDDILMVQHRIQQLDPVGCGYYLINPLILSLLKTQPRMAFYSAGVQNLPSICSFLPL